MSAERTDIKPAKAINYYRLKMIDKDGSFEYSAVRTVNNNGSFQASIYPNPVANVLSLAINSENKSDFIVRVMSMDGKVLLTKQLMNEVNSVVRQIDVSVLKAGNYFVQITSSENEQWVLKLEKL